MPCVGAVCGVVWCRVCVCGVRVGVCVLCACWCVHVDGCVCVGVCVSVSVSVCVCVGVCWCVVLCGVCCVVCVVVCGVVFVVVWNAENLRVCIQHVPVCAFKTFPCVPATCPNVLCMWACCRYTRGHFARTHGDVLNAHTEGGGGEEGRGRERRVIASSAHQNLLT